MAKEVYKGELDSLLRSGALLVDVREDDEKSDALPPIPGNTRVPLSRIAELTERIRRQAQPIVFYCRSGMMSFQAAEIVSAWTQQPVYYLAGGLLGYADA